MCRLITFTLFFSVFLLLQLPSRAQCDTAIKYKIAIDDIVTQKKYENRQAAYYFSISIACGFTKHYAQEKLEILLRDITDSFRILHAQAKADNEIYKTNVSEHEKTIEITKKEVEEKENKVLETKEQVQIAEKKVALVNKTLRKEQNYSQALITIHKENPNEEEVEEAVIAVGTKLEEDINNVSPESDSTARYYKDLSYAFYKLFSPQDSVTFLSEIQKKYFLIPDNITFKYDNGNPTIWNNPHRTIKRADMNLDKPRLLEENRFPKDAKDIINIGNKKVEISFVGGSSFATIAISNDSLSDTLRHREMLTSVNILPKNDTYYALSTSKDNTAKLWIKKQAITLQHKASVNFARFSPNGKYIVTCSDDKTAKLWEVKKLIKYPTESNKALIATFPHSSAVTYCMFDDESKYLLTDENAKLLRVWILPEQIMALIREKNLIEKTK
jgi:WD40 repeat protein